MPFPEISSGPKSKSVSIFLRIDLSWRTNLIIGFSFVLATGIENVSIVKLTVLSSSLILSCCFGALLPIFEKLGPKP